jgi:hypothetical protein
VGRVTVRKPDVLYWVKDVKKANAFVVDKTIGISITIEGYADFNRCVTRL